jgi:sigma-B regulation protein RsbU (phosphoserine phosphatase)
LFLFTDGIIETENGQGEFFGVPRLCELLTSLKSEAPETIIDQVLARLSSFAGPGPLQDDVSMIVMKVV